MFIPGEELWKKLASERTGIWLVRPDNGDNIECVIKFPAAVLKAIYKGVSCYLVVGLVDVEEVRVRFLGIRVDDDPQYPMCTSHPSRFEEEQDMLEELFCTLKTRFHFFDERTRPLFSSDGILNKQQTEKVQNLISSTKPHYIGPSNSTINLSHDIFQQVTGLITDSEPREAVFCELIDLSLEHLESFEVYEFGQGQFTIADLDEGAGLEQSVHGSLEFIFSENTYRSPKIKKGNSKRELSDFLAFDSEQICLIEAKALSIIGTELDRPPERRIKSIEKDINKALRQLSGAVRQIRSDNPIFDKGGNEITISNRSNSILHAIVLLSEINPFIDRGKIAYDILNYSQIQESIFFHVLDLEEIHQLAINTKTPGIFASNLMVRWMATMQRKDILVRAKRRPDQAKPY